MDEINSLKLKRELSLIRNRLRSDIIGKNNTDNSVIKNEKILKDDIEFLVNNFEYIDNISITQYSIFGFTINYKIFYNSEFILSFTENVLPKNHDRDSLDKLILSDINKYRHKKFKIKDSIESLSDIDY